MKIKTLTPLLFTLFLLWSSYLLTAQYHNDYKISNTAGEKQVNLTHTGFYENKGQITDQDYKPNPSVKYLLSSPGFNVQLRQTGFSYDTYTDSVIGGETSIVRQETPSQKGKEQDEKFIRHYHRVDIELVGCNTNAQLITEGRSEACYNYLTATAANGRVSEVHYYSKVTYKNIYPHIDLEFLTSGSSNSVKYNFIVHAGGNPVDIKLEYKGANKVNLKDDRLVVSVKAGAFSESIPSSYIKDTKQSVQVNYTVLGNNTFGFCILNSQFLIPNSLTDLIIDPTPNLEWGTYYGGTGSDYSEGITLDASGNVYITGHTTSTSAIATVGAYQTSFAGGTYDAFVAKFNSNGSALLWATYYGGTGDDYGQGIKVDASGNVYIAGETSSASGIATVGAYQATFGGQYDAFIAKFNSSGSALLWGTYYGGTFTDGGSGISLDASGNVYISGYTMSTSGIATPGAYQATLGGSWDAFVAKFNSTGSTLLWGTYYGGPSYDNAQGIVLDASGNIYLAGVTYSTSAIATPGAYQTSLGGVGDAFVTKFNSSGSALLWGTYYGGTGDDEGMGIALDRSGNVYITGYANSTSAIATQGAYQVVYRGGGYDAFVAKLDPTGSTLLWGTYYGGGGYDYGQGIAVDSSESVYFTGYTTSSSFIATAGAYQINSGGGDDAFVAKLDPTGSTLLWGSYYGGTGNDLAYGIALDDSSNTYITGITGSSSAIATAGAYQITLGGSGWDAFVAKFDSTTPLTAVAGSQTKVLCNGGTSSVTVAGNGGTPPYIYSWAPNGGSNATGTGLTGGTYTVTVTDAHSRSIRIVVIITQPPALAIVKDSSADVDSAGPCSGEAFVNVSGGTAPYIYNWSPTGGTNNTVSGMCPGHYCCIITDKNGCKDSTCLTILNVTGVENITDSPKINIYPNPTAGYFNITGLTEKQLIELYNYTGQKVSSVVVDKSNMYFDIYNMPNGIYLIRIQNKDGTIATQTKIVKMQ